MKLSNYTIYNAAQKINSAFTQKSQYLPAKINFFIQKNAQMLTLAAEEIEKNRISIIQYYGVSDPESGNVEVPEDKVAEASKELEDLFSIEQDLPIHMIDINKFGDIELSLEQMNAIMFMVEGE